MSSPPAFKIMKKMTIPLWNEYCTTLKSFIETFNYEAIFDISKRDSQWINIIMFSNNDSYDDFEEDGIDEFTSDSYKIANKIINLIIESLYNSKVQELLKSIDIDKENYSIDSISVITQSLGTDKHYISFKTNIPNSETFNLEVK